MLCAVKGPKDAKVVAAFSSWIWELGHARKIIQSDGEPAILALVAAVRDRVIADGRAEQIKLQVSPRSSHESNGAAERTVQPVRRMARGYFEQVRERTGSEPSSSPWWAWAPWHAGWIFNRFHVRADTRSTPYSKTWLKVYAQPVLPFGELILARSAHLQKSHTHFVHGCWLGRDSHTDEHIIGSEAGVCVVREQFKD